MDVATGNTLIKLHIIRLTLSYL